ncbi:MAG: tetratricopeptide repeat protein [Chloroflexi bacterium]|nr:tetratricopeptide repeat protein [Chloroflexota bacterium]
MLDALIQQSVCLTQHYTGSPVCNPSRAALLTGRYSHRTGSLDTLEWWGLERLALREEWLLPLGGLAVPGDLDHEAAKEDKEREARSDVHEPSRPSRFVSFAPLRDFVFQPAALDHYAATALFLACVRRLRPDFAPTADDARHIARICRLLEGMPLGIELAAPWAGKLPLGEIADELAAGLGLLATTLRDVPPRHRSMRAAFDRSWALLSVPERDILRQLSVFRGGFTREAAEAVAGATMADLSNLTDRSRLRVEPSGRYAVHELIRQYCGERLGAEHEAEAGETAEQVHDRHAAHYAGFLRVLEPQINWRASINSEVGPETGNLDAAWRWVIEQGRYELVQAMVMGLYHIAVAEGRYQTTLRLFDAAVQRLRAQRGRGEGGAGDAPTDLLLALLLFCQGHMCIDLGLLRRAEACTEESLAVLDGIAPGRLREEQTLYTKGLVALLRSWQGEFAEALRLRGELLSWLRTTEVSVWPHVPQVGTLFVQANECASLGFLTWHLGQYDVAQGWLRESLAIREQLGEERWRAYGLRTLAGVLRTIGELEDAERLTRKGLALSEAHQDRIGIGWSHSALAATLMSAGRPGEAQSHFVESLAVAQDSGHHALLILSLNGLGALALRRGNLDEAGQLYEESRASFERLGIAGTLRYAEAVIGLGEVALARGDWSRARARFREALAARACRAWEKMDAVAGMAQVFAGEGDTSQAAELLALVAHHPFTAHATRERVEALLAELEAELPAEVFAVATARGRARELDEAVECLAA